MLIVHPTSLDEIDELAFAHAVLLCARGGARLLTVHASSEPDCAHDLPRAETLLQLWGLPSAAVQEQRMLLPFCEDPIETLLDACRSFQPDLVVAATHARKGLGRLFPGSVSEALARNLRVPTLLLPAESRGFVDSQSGAVKLQRILIPAGNVEQAERAIAAAVALAQLAGVGQCQLVLLGVGDRFELPQPQVPSGFELLPRGAVGALETAIVTSAYVHDVGLVAMASHGHDSILDVLFGSQTERVLHQLERPLLWVPL